jgi:hypothetical protein
VRYLVKKKSDAYQWTKNRIQLLYNNVKDWKDDVYDSTEKHDVWSMKKLIALSYYVKPFCQIMRSAHFQHLYYVDPFSGSGLIPLLDKYRFPGSPLVPLFRYDEAPFDKYYLSDTNAGYLDILAKMIVESIGIQSKPRSNKESGKLFSSLGGRLHN